MFMFSRHKVKAPHPHAGSLAAKAAGELAFVVGMNGGNRVRSRLESMGLVPGAQIEVVNNAGCGPLLVSLGEGRITLGRGIAEKVLVA